MKIMRIAAAAIAIVMAITSQAQTADEADLSLEANLNTPAISARRHAAVAEKAARLATSLRHHRMRATTLRNGEVVLATIPCDTIFASNSTTPKPEALKRLQPMRDIVEAPSHYKVLVAVHADDTGDEAYSDALTEARANAIDDLLWQLAGREDTNVVIYGLGKDEPLNDNETARHRRANRRIEFYIVPIPEK